MQMNQVMQVMHRMKVENECKNMVIGQEDS